MITNLVFGYCPTCESRLRIPDGTVNGDVLRCSHCEYLMKVKDNNIASYRPPVKFIPAGGGTIAKPGNATLVKSQSIFPSLKPSKLTWDDIVRRATNTKMPGCNVY